MLPYLLQRLLNWSFSYCPNPLKGSFFRKPKPRQWPPCSPSERWDQASPSSVSATINGRVLPLVSMLAIKFVKLHTLDASRLHYHFCPDSLCTKTLRPGLRLSLPMHMCIALHNKHENKLASIVVTGQGLLETSNALVHNSVAATSLVHNKDKNSRLEDDR